MLTLVGWTALAVVATYLVVFFLGTLRTARGGQKVWLFGKAKGPDRLAALGFRLAFAFALLGPLLWLAAPILHKTDPLWTEGGLDLLSALGVLLALAGATLATLAQWRMGRSWRVGVASGHTGDLVQGGLFRFSRNPTFLGQAMLLIGAGLAIPSFPTLLAPLVFIWSASLQIRGEEAALLAAHGDRYAAYMRQTPRWIWLPRKRV